MHNNLHGSYCWIKQWCPRFFFLFTYGTHSWKKQCGKVHANLTGKELLSLRWQNVKQLLAGCVGLTEFGEGKFELLGKSTFFLEKLILSMRNPSWRVLLGGGIIKKIFKFWNGLGHGREQQVLSGYRDPSGRVNFHWGQQVGTYKYWLLWCWIYLAK